MYATLFWLLVRLGRPIGGIRPRRIIHWLAKKAYGGVQPQPSDFKWYRDRYGVEFLLHPHYHLDYNIIAFGTYDVPVANFVEKNIRAGMVCLDVGANVGVVALQLARKTGATGAVHCFEPVPHVFQRLLRHVERNHFQQTITLHQVALSNRTGSIAMGVADPLNTNQGMGSIAAPKATGLVSEIRTTTATLDEFARETRLERLDFIKVDIQGAEPLFLEGGEATLRRFHPDLLLEVEPDNLAALDQTSRDLLRQVSALGYNLFTLLENGDVGPLLQAESVAPDFANNAVLCRAQRGAVTADPAASR
jgi:FkbM family methyltransferase